MSGPNWLRATITDAEPLTDRSRSLRLTVPGWTASLPGQHVDVRLTAPDGYQAARSYSLATSGPGEDLELGIDRLPDGEVSPYLVDIAQIGDSLEVRGPLGGWFVWRPDDPRPIQMIAGGSGVVPFIAMIRARAAAPDGTPFRLLYSVGSPATSMYRSYLENPPAGVTVDWIYSRTAPAGTTRPAGRLTKLDLEKCAVPVHDGPLNYICGSTGFAEHVSQLLIDQGHPASMIKIERYGGN
ncbi:oxidoreductase [Microlunatus sp. Gsoil 973]|nr:oxidoreductase [Microlunatus sp. Gsoil 973]